MTKDMLFWAGMLFVLVLGYLSGRSNREAKWWVHGVPILFWLLLALVGWQVFGDAIKD